MSKNKLTEELRNQIKANYKEAKDTDFSGEALIYLHKVQGAAKARNIKANLHIYVGEVKVSKRSEAYEEIKDLAKLKEMSVREYINEFEESIKDRFSDSFHVDDSHLDKLERTIAELPSGAKIYNNGERVSANEIYHNMEMFRHIAIGLGYMPWVEIEVSQDLLGNVYVSIPTVEQLLALKSGEELQQLIDEDYEALVIHLDTDPKKLKERTRSHHSPKEKKKKKKAKKKPIKTK